MSFADFMTSKVTVHKADGSTRGPYSAQVNPTTIITLQKDADFERGDKITRVLPNGKVESFHVVDANYRDTGRRSDMSHWEVTISRTSPAENHGTRPSQTIHVTAHAVQIGDGNVQNLTQALTSVVAAIDASPASAAEKAQAKGLLRQAFEHPLLAAVVGGASSAYFTKLFGGA